MTTDPTFDLHAALSLALKREEACKLAKPCPECGTDQIQIVAWFTIPIQWKCRECKHEWSGV